MKIILSRKGFDSQYGRQASPILPDGTLLSLPIPSEDDLTYGDIFWNGHSYLDIIRRLKPRTFINENNYCHLDPDLREESIHRENGWLPAYGLTYDEVLIVDPETPITREEYENNKTI